MLHKFIDEEKENWDAFLDTCLQYFSLQIDTPVGRECVKGNKYVPVLQGECLQEGRTNITIAQKKQKEECNKKHANPPRFKDGA